MQDMIALIESVGIEAVREKSVALTSYAIERGGVACSARWASSSPRRATAAERGGHVTFNHPLMREVTAALWERDVIPDYRDPGGLRLGLSPLSTSFAEVERGHRAGAPRRSTDCRQPEPHALPPTARPGDTDRRHLTVERVAARHAATARRGASRRAGERGYEVEVGECMSGDPASTSAPKEQRAAELTRMLLDPAIRAVVPPWGGELAIDLLDQLDWQRARRRPSRPGGRLQRLDGLDAAAHAAARLGTRSTAPT